MTCKDCIHKEVCGGFTPSDLDQDVFDYCREGRTDEIPDIEERCSSFKSKADFVEVVRCGKCKHGEVSIIEKTNDGQERMGCFCNFYEKVCTLDWYCPIGERKEGE